jgi:predicted signal transduction protein with EAL and GGDEF domain
VFRKRVKNPQNIYRVEMIAFSANFMYVLTSNQGIVPVLFWHLIPPLPVVILLGVKESFIWILVMGTSIFIILSKLGNSPQITSEVLAVLIVTYNTLGLISMFSEYVRRETASLLANRQADLETLNQTIMDKALEDPLTSTFNRSCLSEIIPDKISRTIQLFSPISIIIVDIAQFKEVNNSFGHTIGDEVLHQVIKAFRDQLRDKTDDLVRL